MTLNRRNFIAFAASGISLGSLCSIPQAFAGTSFSRSKIKAIAFDAFPIFDPRQVFSLAERLYPGKGGDLSNEWRTRQFEYTWLRVAAQRYADFWQVRQDALEVTADKLNLKLGREQRDELMTAYRRARSDPLRRPLGASPSAPCTHAELPAAIHRDLAAYAAALAAETGRTAVAPEKPIAPMLASSILGAVVTDRLVLLCFGKALPMFNVFADFTNRFVWYR
jgi:hypothetical protein